MRKIDVCLLFIWSFYTSLLLLCMFAVCVWKTATARLQQLLNCKNKTDFVLLPWDLPEICFTLALVVNLSRIFLPFFFKTRERFLTQSTRHQRPRKSAKIYLRLCWCKCWSGNNKNKQIHLHSLLVFCQIVLLSWRFKFALLWGKRFLVPTFDIFTG